jgi:hypothetical protein
MANFSSNPATCKLALLVLFLLSNFTMAAQQATVEATEVILVAAADKDEQLELASWMMGSKQSFVSPSSKTGDVISTNESCKKKFINNGLTTNRILNKTFSRKLLAKQGSFA